MNRMIAVLKANIKWLMISLILGLYIAFLLCKINGLFDKSGKYGIETIHCSQRFRNEFFFIDDDEKTVWGRSETHSPGEYIEYKFRAPRKIGKIIVYNSTDERDVPINISISMDGENWQECEVEELDSDDEMVYTMKDDYTD